MRLFSDLGDLTSLTLSHDNRSAWSDGFDPGWLCERVVVRSSATKVLIDVLHVLESFSWMFMELCVDGLDIPLWTLAVLKA